MRVDKNRLWISRWSTYALLTTSAGYITLLILIRIHQQNITDWTIIAQSLIHEVAAATAVLGAAYIAGRIHTVLAGIVLFLYSAIFILNLELTSAMGYSVSIQHIHFALHPDFIRAGAANLSMPLPTAALFTKGPLLAGSLHFAEKLPLKQLGIFTAAAIAAAVILPAGSNWREGAFITHSIRQSFSGQNTSHMSTQGQDAYEPLQAGQRIIPRAAGERNILIVVLEGIPGPYLETVQQRSGVESPVIMPNLTRIAGTGLTAVQSVVHNRQTIRGLYSLLTADYPRLDLSTPKIYSFMQTPEDERPAALPAVLRDTGYRTSFLQAADLSYMSKDQFMPEAGFENVHGREWFQYHYVDFDWGPDDKAFFEQALDFIVKQDNEPGPWMTTLLTAGTHHPYGVSYEYAADFSNRREASAAYLDEALGDFISRLSSQGILEDTLIVFVSDESHGIPDHPFGDFWGTTTLIAPEIDEPLIVEDVFGLIDIPRTILDYIGYTDEAHRFSGRSLLRRYSSYRSIHFGEFISPEPGIIYEIMGRQQRRYESDSNLLFSPSYAIHSSTDNDESFDKLQVSDYSSVNSSADTSDETTQWSLLRDSSFEIEPDSNAVLTTGQYLEIPAESEVTVRLSMKTEGDFASDHPDAVQVSLQLISAYKSLSIQIPDIPSLAPGESLNLQFTFPANNSLPKFWAHLTAESLQNQEAGLTVEEFSLTAHANPDPEYRLDYLLHEQGIPMIGHAGGSYLGHPYTNSSEALQENLEYFTVFEIDFEWTADDRMIAIHDWNTIFERLYGFVPEEPLTMEEFRELDPEIPITPMDLPMLRQFLQDHPNVRIVPDIKSRTTEGLEAIAEAIPDHEKRIIAQIYQPEEWSHAVGLGYEDIIWTLYRFPDNYSVDTVMNALTRMQDDYPDRLYAAAMPVELVEHGHAQAIQETGIPVYVHTINSRQEMERMINLGVSEVFTDDLPGE